LALVIDAFTPELPSRSFLVPNWRLLGNPVIDCMRLAAEFWSPEFASECWRRYCLQRLQGIGSYKKVVDFGKSAFPVLA